MEKVFIVIRTTGNGADVWDVCDTIESVYAKELDAIKAVVSLKDSEGDAYTEFSYEMREVK